MLNFFNCLYWCHHFEMYSLNNGETHFFICHLYQPAKWRKSTNHRKLSEVNTIRDRIRSRNDLIAMPAVHHFAYPRNRTPRHGRVRYVSARLPLSIIAGLLKKVGNGWWQGAYWLGGGACPRADVAPRIREDASCTDGSGGSGYPRVAPALLPHPASVSPFLVLSTPFLSVRFPLPVLSTSCPIPSAHTRSSHDLMPPELRSLFMHRTCIHA